MYKAILMMLLCVVSRSVAAEWVVVGSNDKATIYVDQPPIHKSSNVVKMRTLFDFKIAASNGIISLIMKTEYDCKKYQLRTSIDRYSGRMGTGKKTSDGPIGKWKPVAPHTFGNAQWKFACGTDTQIPFANPF